jgi:hypothetical protein
VHTGAPLVTHDLAGPSIADENEDEGQWTCAQINTKALRKAQPLRKKSIVHYNKILVL